ncbi:23S rRNA (guanosine(2251)-2'-O)-methyltransferase RlmB [Yunchengibacter salinarum]|uniref:23S rRNA (guanosine(2251)-2'-O)-methyltransferase RlmB n=1 Tax=Yunchengibacter salinarum TaxID=3133399 RepID=UPI0035B59A1E
MHTHLGDRTMGRKFTDRKPAQAKKGRNGPANRKTGGAQAGDQPGAPQGTPASRTGPVPVPRAPDGYFLFGRHSVEAALANPQREIVRLHATDKAAATLKTEAAHLMDRIKDKIHAGQDAATLKAALPEGAPHQGLVMEVRPLPSPPLESLAPKGAADRLLVLDQVTDPHNVGACLRSAAAFGARALITPDRGAARESGTLARASAGAMDRVPWVRVTNLARALATLKEMGYWCVGLDGDGPTTLPHTPTDRPLALVMGAEGRGLRPLVAKNCDLLVHIPIEATVESLNVSNAAAVALYATRPANGPENES